MKVDSVLSSAITGIQRGMNSAREHAAEIASADQFNNDSPSSLVEPMVGLRMDEIQVKASSQVLKAYDAMIGSLFDEKA